jgi:class 3 adenylate cyclase/tetratricopeptide (TPR) repeat protein
VLCPACSFENPDDRATCARCGRPLERTCTACGQSVLASFRFCGHCGAPQAPVADVPNAAKGSRSQAGLSPEAAERRQLTVLFCDLVGSTALAERLDPEELRDVMRVYQALCAEVVARFAGEVAEVAGDGVVVYFGHPRAYEDAAERAVRAGVALTEAVGQLQVSSSMQVRVGIATGLMIIGDVIEAGAVREPELVGAPANLAARLQKVAAPNTVVVSASTRDLVGGVFAYEDLGEHRLEGFSAKIRAFAVVGENIAADRFEARAGVALPPMANREPERALLLERWRRVKEGIGQVVLLSGEPGIGKSRLVRDLRQQISSEPHTFLGYAGSPLHQHTPLYPVAQQLRLAAGINREDAMEQQSAKLEALLPEPPSRHDPERLSLIAELVASPVRLEALPSDLDPGGRKEQLLEVMIDLFEAYATRQPVLLVFEDVQWIDATTRELLDRLVRRVETLPIFLLVTFRSDVRLSWHSLPRVTVLVLPPLDPESCISVVKGVLGNRNLPKGITEEIVARTDGVPLFVEELTKAVLESQAEPAPAPALCAVPETLRDTLMARLDRHQDARSIAQIAAAIGREFPYELLVMIAPMPAAMLQGALDELLQTELIFQHGLPPRATYSFKHALVQEIAYESQLRRRRRAIHGQIAATLHKHFPDTPPEVIGHHYAEAGAAVQAIAQYERAAEIARTRSANTEAAAHFARALYLLATLPAGLGRDRRELALQIAYGAQLVAVKGNAASEVGKAYRRALALSGEVGETGQVSRALRGLQTFYMVRGHLPNARSIGERLLDEAQRADDRDLLLQAHRPHGLCLLYMGELVAARDHLKCAESLYDRDLHAEHRFEYGSDPGVLAHCNLAWVEWFLGSPERARYHGQVAVKLSEEPPPHPHSQAFALSLAASLEQFRGEPDEARRLAEIVIDLADLHHFAYWGPWGHVVRGWARVMTGEGIGGVEETRSGLEAYRATGAGLMCPYFLGLQADALGRVGRIGDGLAAVDEALKLSEAGDIRFYEPELHRIRAELLGAAGASADERIACLQQARTKAAAQASRSLELQALTTLCRVLVDSRERALALDRLREVLAGFSEEHASKPLIEARAVLDSSA